MWKVFSIIFYRFETASLIALLISIHAACAGTSKPSALYFISTEGDYIGQGTTRKYTEGEKGHFEVKVTSPNVLHITYREEQENGSIYAPEYWILEFVAPNFEELKVGQYTSAQRASFQESDRPGFNFYGNGRCSNRVRANFEILEIQYDEKGVLTRFAANFQQYCESSKAPLFGAIRIQSDVPVKWNFDTMEEMDTYAPDIKESLLYLIKYNPSNVFMKPQILSNARPREIAIKQIPCKYHGITVDLIPSNDKVVKLEFTAPFSDKFGLGIYEHALRYPYNGFENPGLEILTTEGSLISEEGAFKVLAYDISKEGWIRNLAIDFKTKTAEGDILEGSLRFHSGYPITLRYPYSKE